MKQVQALDFHLTIPPPNPFNNNNENVLSIVNNFNNIFSR